MESNADLTEVEARLLSMRGMPGLSRVREWGGDKPPVREGINPKWVAEEEILLRLKR